MTVMMNHHSQQQLPKSKTNQQTPNPTEVVVKTSQITMKEIQTETEEEVLASEVIEGLGVGVEAEAIQGNIKPNSNPSFHVTSAAGLGILQDFVKLTEEAQR